MSVKSERLLALWLVQKTRAVLLTNQLQNLNQSRVGRQRFPRFGQFGYYFDFSVVPLRGIFLSFFWLAVEITSAFL